MLPCGCEEERWKPVAGFEAYQISDHGRVKGKAGGLMHPGRLRRGHLRVTFSASGRRTSFQVHQLVLTAFVGPRPTGLEGLHNNDVPDDNCYKNLRWGSHSENMKDAVANGRMPHVWAEADRARVLERVRGGEPVRVVGNDIGVPWRTIYDWMREVGIRCPQPRDKRAEIIAAVHGGATVSAVAQKFRVSQRTIYRWLAKERRHG